MIWTLKNSLLCLVLLAPVCVCAEIYKWVDEEGRTHYGEKPQGEGASKISVDSNPDIDENLEIHNQKRDKLLKIYEEERNMKEEKKQQAEKEERELREKCIALENELKEMQQSGVVFYDLDENDERKYISEQELAAQIEQMQRQYDKYCGY
jgi:hypothetical protein